MTSTSPACASWSGPPGRSRSMSIIAWRTPGSRRRWCGARSTCGTATRPSPSDYDFVRLIAETGLAPEDVTIVVFAPARRDLIERDPVGAPAQGPRRASGPRGGGRCAGTGTGLAGAVPAGRPGGPRPRLRDRHPGELPVRQGRYRAPAEHRLRRRTPAAAADRLRPARPAAHRPDRWGGDSEGTVGAAAGDVPGRPDGVRRGAGVRGTPSPGSAMPAPCRVWPGRGRGPRST